MERKEIEDLRQRVGCAVLLKTEGFALDRHESTRRAKKYRRDADIIIVTHEDRGWFDPLSDAKGDVFSLAEHLDGGGFVAAVDRIADLVGFVPSQPVWEKEAAVRTSDVSVADRWRRRRTPWPGSATWRYLRQQRFIPDSILRAVIRQGLLREGPYASMWAAHADDAGRLTGWEARGPDWRGFARGGAKVLFRLGPTDASRFCVTEAAIDAMSLAALEGLRDGSLYLSTGGGWSPTTDAAIRLLAEREHAQLVAATDDNDQGEAFADRLRGIAEDAGCGWQRLRPPAEDWNESLKLKERERKERKRNVDGRAACPPATSRVKLRPLRGP